jgi:23S rRNA pseudouridine2605 synthase
MRINQYLAGATGLSRRAADSAIQAGRVTINGQPAHLGDNVSANDVVKFNNRPVAIADKTTIMLNKPAGYVVSRAGQGSQTIYDLLPAPYHRLKPVGRLDKDSSGLLLLTNDGELAHRLTHPKFIKTKVYEVMLDRPLTASHQQKIEQGIQLEDGLSKLSLRQLDDKGLNWQVTMREGRNRQIRRTFAAPGYKVKKLHRTIFGSYALGSLKAGEFKHS